MRVSRGRATQGRRRSLQVALAVAGAAILGSAAYAGTQNAAWLTGGQNLNNSRSQPAESVIGAGSVGTLATKFQVTTQGDVSATPAVDGKNVYFPDAAGNLFAVDRSTGAQTWKVRIADLTGIPGDYARSTPAIAGNTLIIGDQAGKFETPDWPTSHPNQVGAWVLALDRKTGDLLWKTRVDSHFAAIVTASVQVNGTTAYVGVASQEEAFANFDLTALFGTPFHYACCSFRGKVLALDIKTGAIRWETYTVPADAGYSGGAVWGSTMPIDTQRGALYVTTGNNYSLPADRIACVQSAGADSAAAQACLPGDNFDSIMSLNLQTGAVNWSYRALPSDAWNTDCGLPGFSEGGTNPGNCPPGQGPDYDFGQGALLLSAKVNGKQTDIVGAGEKSGVFTALDRSTGAKLWATQVSPGGLTGGLQWGSATDGSRIFVARSNSTALDGGGWSALDPSTGDVLWSTPDPGTGVGATCVPGTGTYPYCFTWAAAGVSFGYSAEGPVSTANGVVYACSLSPIGPNMVAMDAASGAIKWTHASGSSCIGGAAIANGTVYWGTGYGAFYPLTTPGNTLFAFTPNGT